MWRNDIEALCVVATMRGLSLTSKLSSPYWCDQNPFCLCESRIPEALDLWDGLDRLKIATWCRHQVLCEFNLHQVAYLPSALAAGFQNLVASYQLRS